MNLAGKTVAITGAAGGLGSAIALEARRRGAREIALLDVDENRLSEVAAQVDGTSIPCDLGDEQEVTVALNLLEQRLGLVDVYAANAGINFFSDLTASAADWDQAWRTHFCPGGIRTPMLDQMSDDGTHSRRAHEEAHTPEAAASILLDGIEADRVLVTTQPRTRDDLAQRGADYEAWMAGVAQRFAGEGMVWPG